MNAAQSVSLFLGMQPRSLPPRDTNPPTQPEPPRRVSRLENLQREMANPSPRLRLLMKANDESSQKLSARLASDHLRNSNPNAPERVAP